MFSKLLNPDPEDESKLLGEYKESDAPIEGVLYCGEGAFFNGSISLIYSS
jgi:hypothetical protein